MNIVILNHYAGNPQLGMEFRPYYLAKEWIRSGNNVLVIGASFSHLRAKQPDVEGSYAISEFEGIRYAWIKTTTYTGNGFKRMLSMMQFLLGLYRYLPAMLKNFKPDLVIASSTYPLDNLPAKWISRKYGALHCYEVHDLWPLSPMELGGYSKNHPFVRVMQWAEDFAYRKAHLVVSMLPNTLGYMIERGLNPAKFIYIPNGISPEEWTLDVLHDDHERYLQSLREAGKVIIGYIGGHALSNALGVLIEVAAQAQKSHPNLTFVLVGNGVEKPGLIEQAKKLSLSNIHFLSPVPKNSVPRLLQKMDVLYLGWHKNPLYRFGISPNKLIDYMMAAKPVVHAVDAANDIVKDAGCGISTPPDDIEGILKALADLTAMPIEERMKMGEKGKQYVLANNDYRLLAAKFIKFAKSKMQY